MHNREKIRLLLCRHGRSQGNDDPRAYAAVGDAEIGLIEIGWQQAIHLGQHLGGYYSESGTQVWPMLFVSSYPRAQQTLSGVLHGMGPDIFSATPKILEDPRLIEQSFGTLAELSSSGNPPDSPAAAFMLESSRSAYKNAPFSARPPFGESPKDIVVNVKSFIDGTLKRDIEEGKKDFLFITHGAVMKAFLMTWFHLPITAWKTLNTPGNCDVILIEGTPKNWHARKIYDGEKGIAVDIDPLAHIQRLTVNSLPPVPEPYR